MTKEQQFIKMLKDNILTNETVTIFQAVVETAGDTSCSIRSTADDIVLNDVQYTSTESNDKGIVIQPKEGTNVLVGQIGNDINSLVILAIDEVQKVTIKMPGLELIADENGLELNGGGNGGLVISASVADDINDLKTDLNNLKTIFATPAWTPVPNDGGAALKAATAVWAGSTLAPTVATDLENNEITH